jgi:hypothetical protein
MVGGASSESQLWRDVASWVDRREQGCELGEDLFTLQSANTRLLSRPPT